MIRSMFFEDNDILQLKEQYPEIDDFKAAVILLRRQKFSYGSIQKQLGNPSKKVIREILLRYEPQLIDMDISLYYNKQ